MSTKIQNDFFLNACYHTIGKLKSVGIKKSGSQVSGSM